MRSRAPFSVFFFLLAFSSRLWSAQVLTDCVPFVSVLSFQCPEPMGKAGSPVRMVALLAGLILAVVSLLLEAVDGGTAPAGYSVALFQGTGPLCGTTQLGQSWSMPSTGPTAGKASVPVTIRLWGGGGGGRNNNANCNGGGNGVLVRQSLAVTHSDVLTIFVGCGGVCALNSAVHNGGGGGALGGNSGNTVSTTPHPPLARSHAAVMVAGAARAHICNCAGACVRVRAPRACACAGAAPGRRRRCGRLRRWRFV
jgi:hypothetical protein